MKKKYHQLNFCCLVLLSTVLIASPVFAVNEVESNDIFPGQPVAVNSPVTVVNGEYTYTPYSETLIGSGSSNLTSGNVDWWNTGGLTISGEDYRAETANTSVDTILGIFDSGMNIIGYDDDSGVGLASSVAFIGTGPNMEIGVSGYNDNTFIGDHTKSGPYDLYLYEIVQDSWDLDYFLFSNLIPGSSFTAEITAGDFDTMLGWYDDFGTLLGINDDSGVGLLSLLSGTASAAGTASLLVADYNYFGSGIHGSMGGTYELTFTAENPVPEPATMLLLGTGLVGVAGAARRKKKRNQA